MNWSTIHCKEFYWIEHLWRITMHAWDSRNILPTPTSWANSEAPRCHRYGISGVVYHSASQQEKCPETKFTSDSRIFNNFLTNQPTSHSHLTTIWHGQAHDLCSKFYCSCLIENSSRSSHPAYKENHLITAVLHWNRAELMPANPFQNRFYPRQIELCWYHPQEASPAQCSLPSSTVQITLLLS